jgi:hypothetical protein
MGCKFSKVHADDDPIVRQADTSQGGKLAVIMKGDFAENTERDIVSPTMSTDKAIVTHDTTVVADDNNDGHHQAIAMEDPHAFQNSVVKQRQAAIDNLTYRSTIEAWKAKSVKELTQLISSLALNTG